MGILEVEIIKIFIYILMVEIAENYFYNEVYDFIVDEVEENELITVWKFIPKTEIQSFHMKLYPPEINIWYPYES